MALNRDEILKARPRTTRPVPCPEWGGDAIVQSMTPSEAAKFEARLLDREGEIIPHMLLSYNERLCIETIVDDHGQRVLSDADLPALMKDNNAAAVRRCADAAAELAGLDKKRNRKQAGDLAGNFDTPRASAG